MTQKKRILSYQALLIFCAMIIVMLLFVLIKNYLSGNEIILFDDIPIILFSSLIAAIVSSLVIQNFRLLIKDGVTQNLNIDQNHESQYNLSLLEATIESTADGILVIDTNKKVSLTNEKFAELWNIPPSLLASKDDDKMLAFILDQLKDPDQFIKKVEDLYRHPEKSSYDEIEFKDGRIFERYSIPQKFGDKILGRVWSFRDITETRQAEKSLRESEKTYKAIFESSTDSMFLMDDLFLDCNDSVCELFECKKEEVIGKSPLHFSPEYQPDGKKSAEAAAEKIHQVKNGIPQRFYWQHKSKSDKLIDAEVSLTPIKLAGNDVILAIVRDITERKKVEVMREALYQISEAAYTASDMVALYKKIHEAVSTLMPVINFYIAIYDEKTATISFPYMVDEYDPPYPPKKAGKGLTEYILKKGEATLIDEKLDLELRETGEVEMIGTPTLIWLGVPLKVEGKTIGVIVVQDYHTAETYGEEEKQILVFVAEQIAQVIERKRNSEAIKKFSEELKELNTTKDKFFSIIAHDLKNPFITILGFSDILLADYDELSDEERKFYVAEMEKSANLSHNLLQNLLQWSRAQTGRIEFNPSELILSDVVEENFQLLRNSANEKKIELTADVPRDLKVFADEDMLNTILRNLLTNSVKFSNSGGTVSVFAEQKESLVEVQVRDSGVGMDQETIDKLFRLDTTNSKIGTSGETGTGLGLILCKEFVEKHNGKIRVESEPGKGSSFIFTFPFKSS